MRLAKLPTSGGVRLLPPPKAPPLNPSQSVGSKGRPISCLQCASASPMAAVRAAMSGRCCKATCNELLLWRVDRNQGERDQRTADRLEPHRGVEIEAVGEPGRGDGQVFFGFLNQGAPPFPLRKCPVGVGFAAFAGIGVVFREPIYLMKLGFRKRAEVEDRLVAQQLEMEHGDVEQDVVRRRLGAETRSGEPLSRGQRLEPGVGQSG